MVEPCYVYVVICNWKCIDSKNMPRIVFSDEQEERLPVPPPRLKRKAKVASLINISSFIESLDKCVQHITSPQNNRSTPSAEKTVIVSECFCTDDANANNSLTDIANVSESTTDAVNDKNLNSNAVSHTVWKRKQPNHRNINETQDGEVDNVCARHEGHCEDPQKAIPFVITRENNSLVQTEQDFRSSVLGNSRKVNSECEVLTGLPQNSTSCPSVTNDSAHLLNEAPTSLYNTHLGKVFPLLMGNSHILIENTGESIEDTAKVVHRCAEYEESSNISCTGKSHAYVNSTIGFSGCCSDGTLDVFHERDEDIYIHTLSENNTVLNFQYPTESAHADTE
jgi:hypothetical protein